MSYSSSHGSASSNVDAAVDTSQFNVSSGQLPSLGGYDRDESEVHPNNIYDQNDTVRHQVRSHFPTCVQQNETPANAQRNGAWNNAASPDWQMGGQSR